jgi:hypothetical protein
VRQLGRIWPEWREELAGCAGESTEEIELDVDKNVVDRALG